MSGQDGVVWFNDCRGNLWSWVDGELELGFLAVIYGETLHKQGCETRSGATSEAVEDEETLETGTLISQFPDSVQDKIDDFFANCVVTASIVVGGIFFAGDQLLRVEELTVGTGTDLINNSRFQVYKDGTRDVFASTSLTEESVEGVIATSNGLITRHLTIRLDTVLQTVQLPACIANLDTGLANVDRDTFTHFDRLFSWLSGVDKSKVFRLEFV